MPFSSLDNFKLTKLFHASKPNHNSINHDDRYHEFCNIYKKHNNFTNKVIPCINCKGIEIYEHQFGFQKIGQAKIIEAIEQKTSM